MNHSDTEDGYSEVLVCGQGRLAASIPACLAASGSQVTLCSDQPVEHQRYIATHLQDLSQNADISTADNIVVRSVIPDSITQKLVIIVGFTDISHIRNLLDRLESEGAPDRTIAIASDHIPLESLQKDRLRPENILVLNWTEPAHTTFFLEIVYNERTSPGVVHQIEHTATHAWGKDPYKVKDELGVRGRMNAAMVREALFLIDQDYAKVEDIDRACRNDAGTYLPFAGNFQYMDLMGTFAYGVVMEQLNKELSNATVPPDFFRTQIKNTSQNGDDTRSGFYEYTNEDMEKWESRMRNFSFEVRDVMQKYPFHYLEKETEQ